MSVANDDGPRMKVAVGGHSFTAWRFNKELADDSALLSRGLAWKR